MNIKFSVVIPTHNREKELSIAIQSVFNQTLLPSELIVIDDCSSIPVSSEIFKSAPKMIRTKLLRNNVSKGGNYSRNKGIYASNGDWIAFLDDDDEFLNNKLEIIDSLIQKSKPNIDIIYHPANYIMVNENITYLTRPKKFNNKESAFCQLLKKNIVGATSMVIVKKEVLIKVGGFDEKLPAAQDYELWLNLAKHNSIFYYTNEILTNYYSYTNKNSVSKSFNKMNEAFLHIEFKHNDVLKNCSDKQLKSFEQLKMGMRIHKSYLNKNIFLAIKLNILAYFKFFKLKYLLGAILSVFNLKFILLIRKYLLISR